MSMKRLTIMSVLLLYYYPYGGKLSREETFMNFAVLELPVKVFSMKLGIPYPPMI